MSQWFYQFMGQEVGPISSDELRSKVDRGEVASDTFVRPLGNDRWVLAERISGLFDSRPPELPQPAPYAPNPDPIPAAVVVLVACADCGAQVSKRASTCPHCGAPVALNQKINEYKALTQKDKWFSGKFDPE